MQGLKDYIERHKTQFLKVCFFFFQLEERPYILREQDFFAKRHPGLVAICYYHNEIYASR